MIAQEVMSTNVVSVGPQASIADVARLLLNNRISALPVLDHAGALVGIISEGDLMRQVEPSAKHRRSWWLEIFSGESSEVMAANYVKSHAGRVEDLMTRNAITASPTTTVHELAALLERHRIKRVPIVLEGRVIGIVSRANLVAALAKMVKPEESTVRTDAAIRREILDHLTSHDWSKYSNLNATVHGAAVELWGNVGSEAEKEAVRVATELVPGVQAVQNNIVVVPVVAGF
jgi:CBS domain-containing protein